MLDDIKHVEAIGLLRRCLLEASHDKCLSAELRTSIEGWMEENHPPPTAYVAALQSFATPSPDTPVTSVVGSEPGKQPDDRGGPQ